MACRVAGGDRFGAGRISRRWRSRRGGDGVHRHRPQPSRRSRRVPPSPPEFDAPILLVDTKAVPGRCGRRTHPPRNPTTIVILGGTTAVSAGGGSTPRRVRSRQPLFGDNRYATAAAVSRYGIPRRRRHGVHRHGHRLHALHRGPDAAVFRCTPPPGATERHTDRGDRRASPARSHHHRDPRRHRRGVYGGGDRTRGIHGAVIRLSGPNRYTTAAAISEYGFPGGADDGVHRR